MYILYSKCSTKTYTVLVDKPKNRFKSTRINTFAGIVSQDFYFVFCFLRAASTEPRMPIAFAHFGHVYTICM
jgi:hypothetical protein